MKKFRKQKNMSKHDMFSPVPEETMLKPFLELDFWGFTVYRAYT